MKLFRLLTVVFVFITSLSIFGDDSSEIWTNIYKRSGSVELKYSVMENIAKINDRGLTSVLEKILIEDIVAELNNKRNINQEYYFIGLSKLVIQKLGEFKAIDSADYIFQVYLNHPDPILQSECLLALGNMRALKYVDNIVDVLNTKNQRPTEGAYSNNDLSQENTVALAAISALDRFKQIDGYTPVFFASLGWYNQRVRNYADKVLSTITENPIDALIPIIVNGDLISKEKAINEVYKCSALPNYKIKAARIALQQGHDNFPNNIRDAATLASIRKGAIMTTFANDSHDIEDLPYLTKSLNNGYDLEERILAIKALSKNNTTEAIEILSSSLLDINTRYVDGAGLNFNEESIVRELIDSLGSSKLDSSKFVIKSVIFSGYSSGIVRRAKDVLKQFD